MILKLLVHYVQNSLPRFDNSPAECYYIMKVIKMYESILEFSFPKFDELPELELYMDQVISLIDMKLSVFADESGKTATPTMINNYVKQKIINPPVKKKYNREHIAQLLMVFVLKRVFSVSETDRLLKGLLKNNTTENVYTEFCEYVEYALKIVFNETTERTYRKSTDNEVSKLFSSSALAFATKIFAEKLITNIPKEDEKDDKQNKK